MNKRKLSAKDKAIRAAAADMMGAHHAELLKLRHRCRKMGAALGMFMAATGGIIDFKDVLKARTYTRSILK